MESTVSRQRHTHITGGLTEVLDWWVHLGHTDHICNGTLSGDDATKRIGVLFTELLEEDKTELAQELVFTALLDDNRKSSRQVSCLLTDFRTLVVEPPENGRDNLGEVWLDADACTRPLVVCLRDMKGKLTKCVNNSTKPVQHDLIFRRLLLECVDDAVHKADLQTLVDVGRTKGCNNLRDRLHDHLPIWLRLILELVDDPTDNLCDA